MSNHGARIDVENSAPVPDEFTLPLSSRSKVMLVIEADDAVRLKPA